MKSNIRYLTIFIFILIGGVVNLGTHDAFCKTLDYNKVGASTYLRRAFGLNKMQKYAYQPGFPTSITFPDNDGVNQNYSAEFGFAYASNRFTTKLGLQLLYPQLTSGLAGKNAAGSSLVSLNSQVSALIPKLDFEYAIKQKSDAKLYIGVGGGLGFVTLKNAVNFTSVGSGVFPGYSDYAETGNTTSPMGEVYTGFELAMFDNVGFSVDVGYQYMSVSTINAGQGSTTLIGTETTGSPLLNNDGTNRKFDMSNEFVAASLRIYLY